MRVSKGLPSKSTKSKDPLSCAILKLIRSHPMEFEFARKFLEPAIIEQNQIIRSERFIFHFAIVVSLMPFLNGGHI